MPCSDFAVLRDFWANGQFLDAAYCPFANQVGGEFTQFIFFTTLIVSLTIYTRQPIVPLVLIIIFGGIIIAPLPGAVASFLALMAVVAAAGVTWLLVRRARQGAAV